MTDAVNLDLPSRSMKLLIQCKELKIQMPDHMVEKRSKG